MIFFLSLIDYPIYLEIRNKFLSLARSFFPSQSIDFASICIFVLFEFSSHRSALPFGILKIHCHYSHELPFHVFSFSLSTYSMSTIILPDVTAFIAALLFAVHPIHTEAVSKRIQLIINSHSNIASFSLCVHLLNLTYTQFHFFEHLLLLSTWECVFVCMSAAAKKKVRKEQASEWELVVNARSQTMTFKEPENLIFLRHGERKRKRVSLSSLSSQHQQ